MSVEECPYCGKPFKRLKSHLPHCKMAPEAQPTKTFKTPQDLPKSATSSKPKIHNKISTADKYMIFDERKAFEDRRNPDTFIINKSVHNAESSQATTEVTSVESTERPKSKWSAKRQKERETVLQKSKSTTSLSDHEGDKSFCEIANGQTQRASQTNGKTTIAKKKIKVQPLLEHLSITKSNITAPTIQKNTHLPSVHENPKLKKVTVLEDTKPNGQSSDVHPLSTVKELKTPTFFTSKTFVWDHIKDSLYYKRSYNVLVPLETHKGFAFETKDISVTMQQSNQLETAKVSSTPSICFFETSIQRPVEDAHGSRLPCLGLNPDIMTAYRMLISTKPFRNSSNENMWNKHQFPGPSHNRTVPLIQQKLGDVRLNELGVWLGAKSPKSSRETVTMLKQGWQWYYRKYIDVRKGGMGGISLLFAGYCVLCYIWRYPHLKKERWRKYH